MKRLFCAAALAAAPMAAAKAAPCAIMQPIAGEPSSPFGPRGSRMHQGLDLRAPVGSPVQAALAGTIVAADRMRGYGLKVDIQHADGSRTRYAHLSGFAPGIAAGRAVAAGQRLGTLGRTGRTTGANLHFALFQGGVAVDPAPWLSGAACRVWLAETR
jgi:murein DD-endopeptidase MepM/ murein hydrolase activator NlpD